MPVDGITIQQPVDGSVETNRQAPIEVPVQIEITDSVYDRRFEIVGRDEESTPLDLSTCASYRAFNRL